MPSTARMYSGHAGHQPALMTSTIEEYASYSGEQWNSSRSTVVVLPSQSCTFSQRQGLVRVALDGEDTSQSAQQITRAGDEPGEIPLGRVGTYLWTRGGSTLIFEAGVPDESGVIWRMGRDGTEASPITAGRHPQPLVDGRVAFLDSKGQPTAITISEPEVAP